MTFVRADCGGFTQPVLLIVSVLTNLLHGTTENKAHAASAGMGQVIVML